MSEHQQFPLAELARFQRGVTWSKAQEIDEPEPGAVPVLRIPNIKERLDTSDLIYLRGVKQSSIEQCAAAKDWILMVGSNGNPDRVGNCVLIKESNEYLFASFLVGIEPTNRGRITPDFLFRVLRGPEIQRYISDDVQGSTGLSNINLTRLKAKAIACPTLPQQRRITKILSTLDEAIEQTVALIAKHQQIKAGLMHDLFTRGVTLDGHLRPTREQAPDLYKESPLGWIPRGWDTATLSDRGRPGRAHLKTGPFGSALKIEHWVEEGHPVITIGALGEGEFDQSELLFVSSATAQRLREYQLEVGDVVFSRVADVGRSAVILEQNKGWIMSSNLMRISLDQTKVRAAYLQSQLAHDSRVRAQIKATVNAGGRDVANSQILNRLLFAWPQPDEQTRILDRVEALDEVRQAETKHLDNLSKQKHGLMHDLLTGKVPVNATPNVQEDIA